MSNHQNEGIMPRKSMILVALLLLSMVPAFAQDSPDQFIGAGASYNGYSAEKFAINGLYAKKLADKTYSFTFVDVISKTNDPFTVTPMVTTGFARELVKIGAMPIYGTTGIGIAAGGRQDASGTNVGWAWTAGFAPSLGLGKNWHMLPNVRVVKASITEWQGIFGVILGWGK
jgi:hypothetical protein